MSTSPPTFVFDFDTNNVKTEILIEMLVQAEDALKAKYKKFGPLRDIEIELFIDIVRCELSVRACTGEKIDHIYVQDDIEMMLEKPKRDSDNSVEMITDDDSEVYATSEQFDDTFLNVEAQIHAELSINAIEKDALEVYEEMEASDLSIRHLHGTSGKSPKPPKKVTIDPRRRTRSCNF